MVSRLEMLSQTQKEIEERSSGTRPKWDDSIVPMMYTSLPGQTVYFRPLCGMEDAYMPVILHHNMWSEDPDKRVSAVCAKVYNERCVHCVRYASATSKSAKAAVKQLKAVMTYFLPVYVIRLQYTKTEMEVEVEKRDPETKQSYMTTVTGPRILFLPDYGRTHNILFDSFAAYEKTRGPISLCVWSIRQNGSGTEKTFSVQSYEQTPMEAEIIAAMPDVSDIMRSIEYFSPIDVLTAAAPGRPSMPKQGVRVPSSSSSSLPISLKPDIVESAPPMFTLSKAPIGRVEVQEIVSDLGSLDDDDSPNF